MSVNTWNRSKDKLPNMLTNNPSKIPVSQNDEAKKGGRVTRNKIGQITNK